MKKPYAVGISGGTCSGKTTLTEKLAEALRADGYSVEVINMDKYFMNPTPNTIAPITGIEYVEHNHPTSMRLDDMEKDYQALLNADKPADIVLMEGIFALHLPEYRNTFDLKIYVDLRPDHRLARRIPKFIAFGYTFEEVVNRYVDTVSFRHDELIEPSRWHADLVVNGTFDLNKGLEAAKACIKAGL
ncbi:ATP/GTP-binding protein [Oscillospiraceae bacterium OttesenSCG-928-F05]|nr:ATP/GTP-binding protein [Oscillospiraceae bacterium OttesenSCG-928-F05]